MQLCTKGIAPHCMCIAGLVSAFNPSGMNAINIKGKLTLHWATAIPHLMHIVGEPI